MYGQTQALTMAMGLDGNTTGLSLNDTTFADGVKEIYRVENMDDGDHELLGRVDRPSSGSFLLDHFECRPCSTPFQVQCANDLAASRIETSSEDGFDPLSIGPTAQDVPAQAIIVDNIDQAIIYHNQSLWSVPSSAISVSDYGGSVSWTWTPGASLSLSFDGVAIWYDWISHAI